MLDLIDSIEKNFPTTLENDLQILEKNKTEKNLSTNSFFAYLLLSQEKTALRNTKNAFVDYQKNQIPKIPENKK